MDVNTLPKEAQEYIAELEKKQRETEKRHKQLQVEYNTLYEKYDLLLFKRFYRSSEKVDATQHLLFDSEETEKPDEPEEVVHVRAQKRKKPGRKPIADHIPRKVVTHDIPEEEKQCACGCKVVKIGERVSEQLEIIPEKIHVTKHVRPEYACKNCEGSGDEEKPAVRVAPPVPKLIPKSIASASLLATTMVNKFVDHLPYYRQEKRFKRIDVNISRQDMSNWQTKAFKAIKPLVALLKEQLKSGTVMHMDETPVQVMKEPGRENTSKSYMWLARGGPPDKPVVIYEYHPTRASKHVYPFIEGFKGYLQTDGLSVYKTALKGNDKITHVSCFAHARRKFHEAINKKNKSGSANEGIKYIAQLYAIEDQLRNKDLPVDKFLSLRAEKAEKVLNKFKAWLDKKREQVPPSVLLGQAVNYTLNEWPTLIKYIESPYLTPDNNASERAIRPFVMGRKNWLFSGCPRGAESSCGIYTLIESAKQNNLEPFQYLKYIFEQTPKLNSQEEFEQLLPWNVPFYPSN